MTDDAKGFWHSKWSPITPLSDQEYKHTIEEKLLRLDADIAIIDEEIKALRDAEKQQGLNSEGGRSQVDCTVPK